MQVAQQTVERRTGTQQFIDVMIDERQEMWVLYCKVAGLKPFACEAPEHGLINQFCQVLVDYISSGHFGLYERIIEGEERRRVVREVAAEVYEQIAKTTDAALGFNDYFEAAGTSAPDTTFSRVLSELGEALATRIELEDRILDRMK
ncbi:MAG: regulator of sigma D [Gammaproteobacteria bacterium]